MSVDLKERGTNVFDLTIKESKATPPPFFDPPTEITDEDWEIIRSRASASNSSLLVAAKLFKPEIIRELNKKKSHQSSK